MSYSRHLHRMIDADLVDRLEAGGKINKSRYRANKGKEPRSGQSYRGARRAKIKQVKKSWKHQLKERLKGFLR